MRSREIPGCQQRESPPDEISPTLQIAYATQIRGRAGARFHRAKVSRDATGLRRRGDGETDH